MVEKSPKIHVDNLEKELGRTVITSKNALGYKYLEENKKLKDQDTKKLRENNKEE